MQDDVFIAVVPPYCPAGQDVQVDAPAKLYVPRGHVFATRDNELASQ